MRSRYISHSPSAVSARARSEFVSDLSCGAVLLIRFIGYYHARLG